MASLKLKVVEVRFRLLELVLCLFRHLVHEGEQAKEPGNEKCFVTLTTSTHLSDVIVSSVFLQ